VRAKVRRKGEKRRKREEARGGKGGKKDALMGMEMFSTIA
jgi:hypothetical protein